VELAAVVLEMRRVMEAQEIILEAVAVAVVATVRRMQINQMQEVVEPDLAGSLQLVTHLT
jgi:hypothetical protein